MLPVVGIGSTTRCLDLLRIVEADTMGEEVGRMAERSRELVCEVIGGEPYEYYPLGEHIVAAPGVCGGRPTYKYTRIDVRHAIGLLVGQLA
jgi:hypothetical protein